MRKHKILKNTIIMAAAVISFISWDVSAHSNYELPPVLTKELDVNNQEIIPALIVNKNDSQNSSSSEIVAVVPPKTEPVKKVETVKATPKTVVPVGTVKWDASALKKISNLAAFDYSTSIREAYKRKIENYAKKNGIKVITADILAGLRI